VLSGLSVATFCKHNRNHFTLSADLLSHARPCLAQFATIRSQVLGAVVGVCGQIIKAAAQATCVIAATLQQRLDPPWLDAGGSCVG
jgi:hypothetical protein